MQLIRSMTRGCRTRGAAVGVALLVLTAAVPTAVVAVSPSGASAAESASPITIAYISSLTGEASPQFATSPGAFKARLDLQNAEGGVNGHKLIPLVIDDQTSPTEIATAVQEADSKAFAIVSQSPLFFLAAKYPQEQGIPVTGAYSDGPEWGEQPYTNMFASDEGSVDPKYPANTLQGDFLKQHGGTVLGAYGYGISPSSSRATLQETLSFKHVGEKVAVENTSVPFGSVDFTPEALVAKEDHVNALIPNMDNNSNFALAEAMKQAGVKLKVALFATGYQPGVINSSVWPSLQGDYFLSIARPWSLPDAGTEEMQAALEKYDGYTKSQFPSFGEYEAWLGADLMIKGLELAGKSPTRAGVIKALRGVTSYNGNGLLPESIDYATIFGHDLAKTCAFALQATKTAFKPVSSLPICGTDIPGTQTANAS